jgi:hypothetical protein
MPIAGEMASLHGRVVEGDRTRDAGKHVAVRHLGSRMILSSVIERQVAIRLYRFEEG